MLSLKLVPRCSSTPLPELIFRGIPQPYPIGSKDRIHRMKAIAREMATGKYDLVALQEIWSEEDYKEIRLGVKDVLPHGHYFHSGFTGSGVCVFTKDEIEDTLMHRYSLNGFAHHVHRGDWFGGKIHAEYDRSNDLYLAHRVVQSFELSQFVKATSKSADLVVVTGDLNLEPGDLGYDLIINNAQLEDSWVVRENVVDEQELGCTCDTPTNSYVKESTKEMWPMGKRIDYILFHHAESIKVKVSNCSITMGKIPEETISYSDHEAVYAEFQISKVGGEKKEEQAKEGLKNLLDQSVEVVVEAELRVTSDRRFFYVALVGLVGVLLYTLNVELSMPGFHVVCMGFRFMITMIIAFCLWYGLVGLTLEEKALKAAKAGMLKLLGKDPLDESLGI